MSARIAAWKVLGVMLMTVLFALAVNWATDIHLNLSKAAVCGAVVACGRILWESNR